MAYPHEREFYRLQYPPPMAPTFTMNGWSHEDTLELEGTVVGTQGGEVAVRCAPRSIPMRVIIREQQRVRQRFPFRS